MQVIPESDNNKIANVSKLLEELSPLNCNSHPHIVLMEILAPNDPSSNSSEFDLANAKKIVGLIEKGAFRVVIKQDLDEDANVLDERFVLTIKQKRSDKELFKARFVVQGHFGRVKEFLLHINNGNQAIHQVYNITCNNIKLSPMV